MSTIVAAILFFTWPLLEAQLPVMGRRGVFLCIVVATALPVAVVWERFSPCSFDFSVGMDRVEYAFRDKEYARQFARLNETKGDNGEGARERKRLLRLIEEAFDGVRYVGPDSLSLYQAQAADDYSTCDQSRDHKGRWQDTPFEHFLDCPNALSFLDAKGLQYYLPALMSYSLSKFDVDDGYLIFEFLLYAFDVYRSHDTLYEHSKERFHLFTLKQKQAVAAFLRYMGDDDSTVRDWESLAAGDPWPSFQSGNDEKQH